MAEDGVQPTQTVLMEAGYRIKISGWSFVQPFAQYISRPDGFADVANAAILGVSLGVDF
jgi:carbohydrate-selective porin OprB